ncbi:MAG: hypothetical protein KA796_11980 [Chryseobacterium sp.]|nr:hypothetical protein [Chryseobacterium sp.]MBP7500565.1 hypothetical protein [Chryseobacterium sp.]
MIYRIGDTYISLDKILAIKLNSNNSLGPTNIVKLILLENLGEIEVEFKDYQSAKLEVDALVADLEDYSKK